MSIKLLSTARAVTFASGTIIAQEMGTATPVQNDKPEDGLAIIAAADEAAPKMNAAPPAEELVSAADLVMNNLSLIGKGIGYDPKTDAITVIGEAAIKVNDPATDPNFNTIRESKATEAYLSAKAETARAVSTELKSVEYSRLLALAQNDETAEAHRAAHKALEEKRDQLATHLKQLNAAEADKLSGVTLGDRLCSLLDGVIKQLDAEHSAGKTAEDKIQVCQQLKAECQQLKAEYAEPEKAAM